ncbi:MULTISPECIES: ester cyclase [unclassified Mucilaginibacter]|uniref:ester cyclase n=1 Tax=unclassified Mucilaginibacter TaxID=2617802 RepID=UPI002AC8A42D|nr:MULTISPECIES: ester cyclase [unclassified Mucilaginibacter]MEB0260220.1 ester cyclase [Mucilaginibacter sp. 10I4]MEB0277369.1 ester cyclase [Mucilaginibacter sp. 10B2]MEB0300149.1 ester cyclase [Mucilaginibacter sp. 5C4]WPX25493.1 ester cyclase [Mucilaginibacter sp. 5C4]
MSKEANIEAQKKFGEAVNNGNLEALKDVVAEGSVDHDPADGQVAGPQGYIDFFTELRTAFPDVKIEVKHLVADDENVSFAYEVTGTHNGDFMGIAPTGKAIKARGMQISKFENGKMTERWGSSNELGILKQLGKKI